MFALYLLPCQVLVGKGILHKVQKRRLSYSGHVTRVKEAEEGQASDGLTAGDDCGEKGLYIVQSQEDTEDRHM